ncbi:hypothetical protein COY90_01500 [Candidatus Roizmanbacteria bacterium CG_4_10_14_0_8_um_filter_39_9]|uniref:DNA polymerase III delta N-terminal domain-containing protein n=1 Tax=Candidatus Roizmanbacteria bacterium CG_4_10_14_0_8_um_filter_39_9 TaxID=1974829 RepID=A0A2M7QEJ8_9BACT|nr:MAG: hypothetical protein COY90_01500 [Candidatus Roizmanbacteria bacterium CG_4_10_14_0_8_um_filter_39_9]
MLTVFCGEDTVKSRLHYNEARNNYIKQGYRINDIVASEIEEILKWQGDNLSLFNEKQLFFSDHVNKHIVRKRGKKSSSPTKTYEDNLKEIASKKNIELIDWEEKSARDIKIGDYATIHESKLSESIFKLLESCSPGSKQLFITNLMNLSSFTEEQFIYIMLTRHIRSLILATEKVLPKGMFAWQAAKLSSQAQKWKKNSLVQLYEALCRLDLTIKTGTNPYGILKSLDILACHYL